MNTKPDIDEIDLQILEHLLMDSSLSHKHIAELHRVSGEGCYWMRVRISTPAELNDILDELLRYGNYKLSLSISQVK